MSFDIVIPWVDWSNKYFVKKMIENGGRSEGCESGEVIELKYLLRSLDKNKVDYDKIYIVYSDNHPPPKYLKETERLKFVPHSMIVKEESHLPLIHRESIISCLHRIPNLNEYYFLMEDDLFIMNGIIFEEIIEQYKNKNLYTFKMNLNSKYDVKASCGLYFQGMINSARIICGFKQGVVMAHEHTLQFFDKKIMHYLEKTYNKQFMATMSYKNQEKETYKEQDIINVVSLFNNFLVYKLRYSELSMPNNSIIMIHTGGYSKINEIERLKIHLLNRLNNLQEAWILNAQGDGISDEFSDCPIIHEIFYTFLEKTYPIKTDYECV